MTDVLDGAIIDPRTNCLLWLGRVDPKGRPMAGRGTEQRLVARRKWLLAYHLELPSHTRLRPLCRQSLCVGPWHRCLASPMRILKREGIGSWRLSRLRGAFRKRSGEDQSWPVTWLGGLRLMECAPFAVARISTELDVSILSVLAVYATLIPKEVE